MGIPVVIACHNANAGTVECSIVLEYPNRTPGSYLRQPLFYSYSSLFIIITIINLFIVYTIIINSISYYIILYRFSYIEFNLQSIIKYGECFRLKQGGMMEEGKWLDYY
jgi:hypothetical protein